MNFDQSLETTHKRASLYNPLINSKRIYEENVPKTITLRNLHGPYDAKALCRPIEYAATKELLGVARYTDEEKKQVNFAITKKNKLEVTNGTTFDLSDEAQRTNWNWVQYSPYIAETKDEGMMSPMAMFYVEDEEREVTERVTKADLLWAAEKLVRDWKPDVRMNRARLLGQDLSMHTQDEVLMFLVDKARSSAVDAQAIIEIENDNWKDERLLLLRWTDAGIIEEKNKSLYFGSIRIGVDQRSALGYILQSENRDIVESMRANYERLRRPNLSGHVDVPARGPAAASSTSVNPPMRQPGHLAAPAAKAALSLQDVAKLAPLGYTKLEASLDPDMLHYLSENPDEELFKGLIRDEIKLRMTATTLPTPAPVPTPPAPIPAAVAVPVPVPVAAATLPVNPALTADDDLLGDEHQSQDEQPDELDGEDDSDATKDEQQGSKEENDDDEDFNYGPAPVLTPAQVPSPNAHLAPGFDADTAQLLTRPAGAPQPTLAEVKGAGKAGGRKARAGKAD